MTASWISADRIVEAIPDVALDDSWPISKTFSQYLPPWHQRSACRDIPEADRLFFGESDNGTKPALSVAKVKAARAICAMCPVSMECAVQALTTPEKHGIWAGTTGRQRERIRASIKMGKTVAQCVDEMIIALGRIR